MKKILTVALGCAALVVAASVLLAAEVVPTDVQQPGTQPREVGSLESPDKCDNCHGGYDPAVEPAHNWRGSMMGHAGRDPIFWATVAVAEQDFDGVGDLCLRCHVADGWVSGRSTPTDGTGLSANDGPGVNCDLCHTLTDPDGSEHAGVQLPPFVANDGGSPPEGYYGSGEYVLWGGSEKLGPYTDAQARHQSMASRFHRSSELCGTCHDVSNPVVGDLAHNFGAQVPLDPGTYSGVPGDAVENKAAFNNPPYAYGVVERTFSEHMASAFPTLSMFDYPALPAELQDGSIARAYDQAMASGNGGNYADGTLRTFTCQTCHLPPVQGPGCNKKGVPVRSDMPRHDMTGGNYWAPDAIVYLDDLGRLVFGGGLTSGERSALADGQVRAVSNLRAAASLSVAGDVVTVVNLTGHKLISGYPEGRRMWLDVRWYDDAGNLLREDGAYGPLTVTVDGAPLEVRTLVDLHDPNTRVYEAHGAITQEWASQLVGLGYPPSLPVSFDRVTGVVATTLGDVAAGAPGSYEESFHFALNNLVAGDNRIPPYGFRYDEARRRNALPVPATQFGDPGPGGVYRHWDEVTLAPPAGASYATIDLLYQPTSWEYVQFLHRANDGSVASLASTGGDLLDAWLATGMAEPVVMASATWGSAPSCTPFEEPELTCDDGFDGDCDGLVDCDDPDCSGSPACSAGDCGNGVCDPGEDCLTCPSDCPGETKGKPANRYCCGDGVLDPPEGDGSICDGNF